jgi:hypothetical protein
LNSIEQVSIQLFTIEGCHPEVSSRRVKIVWLRRVTKGRGEVKKVSDPLVAIVNN